jgi:hypothetical protein
MCLSDSRADEGVCRREPLRDGEGQQNTGALLSGASRGAARARSNLYVERAPPPGLSKIRNHQNERTPLCIMRTVTHAAPSLLYAPHWLEVIDTNRPSNQAKLSSVRAENLVLPKVPRDDEC